MVPNLRVLITAKHFILFFLIYSQAYSLQAQNISSHVNSFLNTLTPELREKALFELSDEERFNMNYVPIKRKGPTFHDFNDEQEEAAIKLLKASMSAEGYRKSREIMKLEAVLKKLENGNPGRDPLDYHFCVFGDPSSDKIWGWRFEGHHLSLNFTTANNRIVSSTPSFFGTNPAIVDVEGFEKREILKMEQKLGFQLVNMLDKSQLSKTVFAEKAPADIITKNFRKVEKLEPTGISIGDLNDAQEEVLMTLLNVYIDNYELGFAETLREKISEAGYENLSFAWAGSLKPGAGHYYRIQGPMLLIEYDNTQNNANHVHTVVRDLTNDYAEDLLREHYKHDH